MASRAPRSFLSHWLTILGVVSMLCATPQRAEAADDVIGGLPSLDLHGQRLRIRSWMLPSPNLLFVQTDTSRVGYRTSLTLAKRLRAAGIAAIGVGVLVGTGAVMMATTDACAHRAGNSCSKNARTRAAVAMGIPAGIMLGGGLAMLVVSTVRLLRLRK